MFRSILIAGLLALVSVTRASLPSMSSSASSLFSAAMAFNEQYFDTTDGYLYSIDSAGIHDTRATAMWVPALLARNGDGDVARATRILKQITAQQYKNASDEWYGTYPHTPQDPFPGTSLLGTKPYSSYDPNWRDFVSTAWALALGQYEHLLSADVVQQMEQSLLLTGKGNLKRYQGRGPYANSILVNTSADNGDAAYTNPWLMGTFTMSYIAARLNDSSLYEQAEKDAQTIYDLFTWGGFNTFAEYNSGTYTGVDIWALSLWVKFAPKNSKLKKYGPFMLKHQMIDIGDLYNSGLRNLAGPFDRSYGFDMTRYHAVLGYAISTLAPESLFAYPNPIAGGMHTNDAACFASLLPLVADVIKEVTPEETIEQFATLRGERMVRRQVLTNTEDMTAVRNVTAWLGERISIGGQSLDEPAVRQSSMVPALIQYLLPASLYPYLEQTSLLPKIGYIALSPPTASVINATASAHTLHVSFPPSSRFPNATIPTLVTLRVGGFDMRTSGADMTKGVEGVPGLNVTVETQGLGQLATSYDQTGWNTFYPFNVTYPVTAEWPDVPSIKITVY